MGLRGLFGFGKPKVAVPSVGRRDNCHTPWYQFPRDLSAGVANGVCDDGAGGNRDGVWHRIPDMVWGKGVTLIVTPAKSYPVNALGTTKKRENVSNRLRQFATLYVLLRHNRARCPQRAGVPARAYPRRKIHHRLGFHHGQVSW